MAEERLRRNLDSALDPGPDFPSHQWRSRTMAAIASEVPRGNSVRGIRAVPSPYDALWRGRRFAAVVALIALAVAATAGFLAIHSRFAPAPAHPPGSIVMPIFGGVSFSSPVDASAEVKYENGTRKVFITHDGGQSWMATPLLDNYQAHDHPVADIRWIDPKTIVAVVTPDLGSPTFLSSSDGGHSWNSVKTLFQLDRVFFLNSHEGWAICAPQPSCAPETDTFESGDLYHTTDFGVQWQLIGRVLPVGPSSQSSGCQSAPTVSRLYFTDSLHGFASTASLDNIAQLAVTQDGGLSWRLIHLPAPPGGWASPSRVDPCGFLAFADLPAMFGSKGVLLANDARGDYFTYTTNDGGLTWGNARALASSSMLGGYLPVLAAHDFNLWLAVDGVGDLYRTIDNGQTWLQLHPRVARGYRLESVTPVGGNVTWGIAHPDCPPCGPSYAVRSTDDGATWALVSFPAPN